VTETGRCSANGFSQSGMLAVGTKAEGEDQREDGQETGDLGRFRVVDNTLCRIAPPTHDQ